MEYGISHLSMVPVRVSPSEKSEMTSMILFGEHFSVPGKQKGWRFVKNAFDGYTGWIDSKMYCPIRESEYEHIEKGKIQVNENLLHVAPLNEETKQFIIYPGSNLIFTKTNSEIITIAQNAYVVKDQPWYTKNETIREKITRITRLYMYAPYLWGGRSPFGIDCSGFTQVVYKIAGIKIPRDSFEQETLGTRIESIQNGLPGDLAFFKNETGKIVHTGILLENKKIIHASGYVRIDSIDETGIINSETRKHSHFLHSVKSFINA